MDGLNTAPPIVMRGPGRLIREATTEGRVKVRWTVPDIGPPTIMDWKAYRTVMDWLQKEQLEQLHP